MAIPDDFIQALKQLSTLKKELLDKAKRLHAKLCNEYPSKNPASIELVLIYILLAQHPEILNDPNIESLYARLMKLVTKEWLALKPALDNPQHFINKHLDTRDVLDRIGFLNMLIDPKNKLKLIQHMPMIHELLNDDKQTITRSFKR